MTLTIIEQVQKVITKLTGWTWKPRLQRKAQHTQPLDAQGPGCEIDANRQTPEGRRLETSQTRINNTLTTGKNAVGHKSKFRKLASKQTIKADRPGVTVKLKTMLIKHWRELSVCRLRQPVRLSGEKMRQSSFLSQKLKWAAYSWVNSVPTDWIYRQTNPV